MDENLTPEEQRIGTEANGTLADKHRAASLYEELRRQLLESAKFSDSHASRFSNTYYFLRPASLILAVSTALASSISNSKNIPVIILASLVTLVTALDSWIKPQVKWKLYDEQNDRFNSMLLKLTAIGNENFPALDALRQDLDGEIERYRTARLLD